MIVTSCFVKPAYNVPKNTPGVIEPQSSVVVYIRDNEVYRFSKEEKEAIIEGFVMWQFATRSLVDVRVAGMHKPEIDDEVGKVVNGRCQEVVIVTGLSSKSPILEQFDDNNTVGLCARSECSYTNIYFVMERITNTNMLKLIATHELGHAIGLSHVADSRSILNSTFYENMCIGCLTKYDLAEFCKLYDCDVEDLVYCKPLITPWCF